MTFTWEATMKNWISGIMMAHWTVRHISGLLQVSKPFAKLYLQPCQTPDEVIAILDARNAIEFGAA